MSITDELREFMDGADGYELWCPRHKEELNHIADRIDAEHERTVGFCKRLEDAAAKREDVEIFGVEYTALPLDADGEPIRVGDVMEWLYGNGEFIVEGIGGNTLFYIDKDSNECEWTAAGDKRHHHAPTVEDVLREFTDEVWNRCCEGATASDSGIDGLVAECAARLRLAGEDE